MKIAFARLFGGEETYGNVLEQSGMTEKGSERDSAFADELLAGIEANLADIDSAIDGLTVDRSFDRIPRVDLCILRIAVYEIMFLPEQPAGIAINEAVELAKAFGDDNAPSYINGILGALARRMSE